MTLISDKQRFLEGKVALVTGASRGIGAAITSAFLQSGAIVYANVRKEDALVDFRARYGEQLKPICFDITNYESAKSAVMQIHKEQKKLDVLVNNAGIMIDTLIGMITHELMQKIFETNVFAPINLSQLAARMMTKNGSGSIINIASIVGTKGNAGQSVYSASKGALISFTLSASKELASKGVRVNAIAPGVIDTDLLKNVDPKYIKDKLQRISMGRIGCPEDVAAAVLFFASDLSKYITGQILGVDGGQIA
jgi:3-oxoacyl-[acyl-carrier protein] reductase